MLFQVSCALEYTVKFPSTLILSVHAQRNASQTVLAEQFDIEPRVRVGEFTPDSTNNRFIRLETGRHKKLSISYSDSV